MDALEASECAVVPFPPRLTPSRRVLSRDQAEAHARIKQRMRDRVMITVMMGLAGTGKTSLLHEISLDYHGSGQFLPVSLTGKAAFRLREVGLADAETIHSTFFNLIECRERPDLPTILRFAPRHKEGELRGSIVAIDEMSMVDQSLAEVMIRSGAVLLACGDPGQLPPVAGEAFFTTADVTLTEIHRQALESPIIRQAHSVRERGRYVGDGDDFRVVGALTDDALIEADAVLVHTNATRALINQRLRRLLGFSGRPRLGEPVLCLKNARQYGIFNGGIYRLAADYEPRSGGILLDVDGPIVSVPYVAFVGVQDPPRRVDRQMNVIPFTSRFDFGYCLTVHKSQGSEWPSILLVDEYRRPDFRREWVYTGITRASKRITVVNELRR